MPSSVSQFSQLALAAVPTIAVSAATCDAPAAPASDTSSGELRVRGVTRARVRARAQHVLVRVRRANVRLDGRRLRHELAEYRSSRVRADADADVALQFAVRERLDDTASLRVVHRHHHEEHEVRRDAQQPKHAQRVRHAEARPEVGHHVEHAVEAHRVLHPLERAARELERLIGHQVDEEVDERQRQQHADQWHFREQRVEHREAHGLEEEARQGERDWSEQEAADAERREQQAERRAASVAERELLAQFAEEDPIERAAERQLDDRVSPDKAQIRLITVIRR